jgi:lipid A 3-O-deacylase
MPRPTTLSLLFLMFTCLIAYASPLLAADIAKSPAQSRDSFLFHSGVSGLFDSEKNPTLALEYRCGSGCLDLEPWMGGGWATDGAVLIAIGIARTWVLDARWQARAGVGPGYYDRHEGLDLGSHLEFYSFVELDREVGEGHGLVLRLAHISNGGLSDSNPGTELLSLGYRIQLR